MTGRKSIAWPEHIRKSKRSLTIKGAKEHNLQELDITIPLNMLVAVTGVSGSGKTSLIKDILYPALSRKLGGTASYVGVHKDIDGDISSLQAVELVDQNPIGRSSRSNPVTYIKAFDDIRALYADQGLSETRGFKPSHFSFNVAGGRCDACEGEGKVTISMQFMADIELRCDDCKGRRYKNEILEVIYKEKSIADILDMTVDDAIHFFADEQKGPGLKIKEKLAPLQEVGLGYVTLGQSSSTLSGGEAQRIKLAFFLSKRGNQERTLFIFDEPTTGLHFHDVSKLLLALNALIDQGHSVIVIEHNLDMVKSADHIIDLGPGGGEEGGKLIFQGTPAEMLKKGKGLTAKYLKEKRSYDMALS